MRRVAPSPCACGRSAGWFSYGPTRRSPTKMRRRGAPTLPPLGVVSSVAPARQQVGTRASGDAEHLPSMDAAAAGHKFDEVN